MTKLRVVEPTTDLTRVSEGIAQLEIMLNDVIKVSDFVKRCAEIIFKSLTFVLVFNRQHSG